MFIDIVLDGGQYNIRIKHRNMIKRNFKKYEITPLNPVQIHNLPWIHAFLKCFPTKH